ncbi:MAG TPA: hypothetical protein VFK37_02360 [Bacillales bacterium]|nr:hypothetical protein [Bacillales bacterium]
MGYILPYVPAESIQYHNRINFERWRAVNPVERSSKARLLRDRGQSTAADVMGKGRNVDEKA